MHTDHDPIDPKTLAEMGYEHRDVSPKPMVWAAFWLFVFTIGSGILGAFFIKIWNIVPEVVTEQRAFHKVQPPKDTPILQNNSDNTADIATLRRNEAKVLRSSGEVGNGFYHIPIDTAITLITQRGMPVTGTQSVTRPKPGTSGATSDSMAILKETVDTAHVTGPGGPPPANVRLDGQAMLKRAWAGGKSNVGKKFVTVPQMPTSPSQPLNGGGKP